jgi:CRISPR/Cas system-associated exonuclease Cas4 (RecB family)
MEPVLVFGGMCGALLLLSIACLIRARQLRRRSGLPAGQIVYDDAGGQASAVLVSERYGLRGKPDYLLRDTARGGLIPVEVKHSRAPRSGQPYPSHRLQLAVYLLLVEDVLGEAAPYGLLRYHDQTLRVAREELLAVLAEMRALQKSGRVAHRDHAHAQRCAGCSLAQQCDERLVTGA